MEKAVIELSFKHWQQNDAFRCFLLSVVICKATNISVLQQRVWQSVCSQISHILHPYIAPPTTVPLSVVYLPGFGEFLFLGCLFVCLFGCGNAFALLMLLVNFGSISAKSPLMWQEHRPRLNNNIFTFSNFSLTKILYHLHQLIGTEKRELLWPT